MRVHGEVFCADARSVSNAVNETWRWEETLVVDREGDETLVDLLDLCGVLHTLRSRASAAEGGKKDREEKGDDAHHDEQLNERESTLAAAVA